MKHIMQLLFVLGLISIHSTIKAQDFGINVKADSLIAPGSKGSIELLVIGGKAPFVYLLFDKEPWEGGKSLGQSNAIYERTYQFKNLAPAKYLTGVRDSEQNTKLYFIEIRESGTAYINIIKRSGSEKVPII